MDVVRLGLWSRTSAYCVLQYHNVWRNVDKNAERRCKPSECGRKVNCVDGYRRVVGDAVVVVPCASVKIICRGATYTLAKRDSSCARSELEGAECFSGARKLLTVEFDLVEEERDRLMDEMNA